MKKSACDEKNEQIWNLSAPKVVLRPGAPRTAGSSLQLSTDPLAVAYYRRRVEIGGEEMKDGRGDRELTKMVPTKIIKQNFFSKLHQKSLSEVFYVKRQIKNFNFHCTTATTPLKSIWQHTIIVSLAMANMTLTVYCNVYPNK